MKRLLLVSLLLIGVAAVVHAVWDPAGAGPAPTTPEIERPAGDSDPEAGTEAATAPLTPPDDGAGERRLAPERELLPLASANADQPQGITGVVVDRNDRPLADVAAFLVDSARNDPIGRMLRLRQQMPTPPFAAGRSGPDGVFRLGLRDPGDLSFEVHLLADGFAAERLQELRVVPGEWLDLGRITLQPGATIRGRVTIAGTDLPAPQATVTLDSGDPFLDLSGVDLPGWRGGRSVAVDANGRYEMRHAPRNGLFRLTAAAPGFARAFRSEIELVDGLPVTADFELEPGLTISGTLVGDRPVTRAAIEVWAKAAEPAHYGSLGDDGSFEIGGLHAGDYLVRIHAEGFEPRELPRVPAGAAGLRVELRSRAGADLTVRTPEGAVLTDYRLAVRRWFPDNGGNIAAVRDVPDRSVRLAPGQTQAHVDGLEQGLYVFQVWADGFASSLSPSFAIDREHRAATVEMTVSRGATLRGRIQDEQGRPIGGAEVRTQPRGAAEHNPVWRMVSSLVPDRITRITVRTTADGSFTLPGLAHADYQLAFRHPDYCEAVRKDLAVDADGDRALPPVTLMRGAEVRGRAFVDGVLRPQVRVVLTPPTAAATDPATPTPPGPDSRDENAALHVEAVTDNQGQFRLDRRIPAGTYEIRAVHQAGGDPAGDLLAQFQQMQKSMQTVTVRRGQELVEVELHIRTDGQ